MAGGPPDGGEAGVCTGLLVFLPGPGGQRERRGVLGLGIGVLSGGEQQFAQAVECVRLAGQVTGFLAQRARLLEVARRLLVAALA